MKGTVEELVLVPRPRRMEGREGWLHIDRRAVEAIEGLEVEGVRGIRIRIGAREISRRQGYRLEIGREGIGIGAHDEAGARYAVVTLRQIVRQAGKEAKGGGGVEVPCLVIEDWPEFAVRGYMLDISRDKVPRMATLYRLVDLLVELKLNQLQLYTEHTFAYRGHEEVWRGASPMRGEEVRALDRYCRERGVELVPNQNSFGHMERWLRHRRYRGLAETPEGFDSPWGGWRGPSTLCPVDRRAVELLADLYGQLLRNFSSRWFNVGCDETWELGQGRSRGVCRRWGRERVWLGFLKKIRKLAGRHGRRIMFWADVILGRPELVREVPKDTVGLIWGYEADHPFGAQARVFAEAGRAFYVCPGTSTWNSLAGRLDNALENLRCAAEAGLAYGAAGYLMTDWGDNGHMQPLTVSFGPMVYGAAVSWGYGRNREMDLAEALNRHVFMDEAERVGEVAMELGRVYRWTGIELVNATVLGRLMYEGLEAAGEWLKGAKAEGFREVRRRVGVNLRRVKGERMQCVDRAEVRRELELAGKMAGFAAALGAARCGVEDRRLRSVPMQVRRDLAEELDGLIEEYRRVWRMRNREGGLKESVGRLERLREALIG